MLTPEDRRALDRERYALNIQYHRDKTKKYAEKNREQIAKKQALRRASNLDAARAIDKKSYEKCKDARNARRRANYAINSKSILDKKRKWRQNNPKQAKAHVDKWRLNNPDKVKEMYRRKRDTKKNTEDFFNTIMIAEAVTKNNNA